MEKTELGECNSNKAALPCANNCGFYGSPANLNFCSKCYQEHLKSNPTANVAASNVSNTIPEIDTIKTKGIVEPFNDNFNNISTKSPTTSDAVEGDRATVYAADTDRVTISPVQDDDNEIKQKDTTRCWDCNTRVGLLGFKCRCGYTFCKKHRQTEAHGCTFDFFTFNQEQLKRSNQKVVADKLERI